jgi:signal transduction histidine kinase
MVTRESSSRTNDAFLAWLNHELRSPLNACAMWLDVLALGPQPDKLAQAVDALKRNLARQTRLVNDLNDAAKVSSGGIELHFAPLDLAALLRVRLGAWQSLAEVRHLSFSVGIELEPASIHGDTDRLLHALNHVVESAIGSTPAGGAVGLRLHGTDGRCVLEVADTGVPLSAEDVANLAVPLWRSPTAGKARAGLGLGLAVAHHIVVKHGGSFAATSDGAGARFVLTLPLAVT